MINFITKQKRNLLKATTLLSCASLLHFNAQAQCPTSTIELYTQEDIDNFAANYPGCTEITNGIYISGMEITNLLGLSGLTKIGENLSINYTYNLTNLEGLNNVTQIGILDIYTNYGLVSLDGLENVTKIDNNFYINYNSVLSDISAIQYADVMSMTPDWWSTDLVIHNNPDLSICHYSNICEYLDVFGTSTIHSNSGDCENLSSVTLACAEPLSVRLSAFDLVKQAQSILINWSAGHEDELESYTIEKSVNGQSWNVLTKLSPKYANINRYSTTDVAPALGVNMYRIKMVSKSGEITYSEVKSVDFVSNESVAVYPNPVKDVLNITSDNEYVSVKNILGVEVFSGKNVQSIDVASWAPGVYFVHLSSGEVVKLIKE